MSSLRLSGLSVVLMLLLSSCQFLDVWLNPPAPAAGASALTAFSFVAKSNGLTTSAVGVLSEADKTVTVQVPAGTSVVALKATFTSSEGTTVSVAGTDQVSGTTAQDFSSPVTYVVTAGDGTVTQYVVTVSVATPVMTLTTGASASVVVGQANFTATVAGTTASAISSPLGNPIIAGGKLFINDFANSRVLGYNAVPKTNGVSANFVLGTSSLTGYGTTLNYPYSLASNGSQFAIADYSNHSVKLYNSIPTSTGQTADLALKGSVSDALVGPSGVSLTGTKLLVADATNSKVYIWKTLPKSASKAADLTLGDGNTSSATATSLHNPTDVWSDGTRVVVVDSSNNRVLIWNTFPTTSGQQPDVVLGQADFTHNATALTAKGFDTPTFVSSNGTQLAVADSVNNRVLVWAKFPTVNNQKASVVLGQSDFTSNGFATSNNSFHFESGNGGVFLDATRLVVADSQNHRVLIFRL